MKTKSSLGTEIMAQHLDKKGWICYTSVPFGNDVELKSPAQQPSFNVNYVVFPKTRNPDFPYLAHNAMQLLFEKGIKPEIEMENKKTPLSIIRFQEDNVVLNEETEISYPAVTSGIIYTLPNSEYEKIRTRVELNFMHCIFTSMGWNVYKEEKEKDLAYTIENNFVDGENIVIGEKTHYSILPSVPDPKDINHLIFALKKGVDAYPSIYYGGHPRFPVKNFFIEDNEITFSGKLQKSIMPLGISTMPLETFVDEIFYNMPCSNSQRILN